MISSPSLHFINNNIKKLQTAIFYNFSDSILRFPACIIHEISSDKNGQLLFLLQKPYRDISDFDNSFAGQLHFYNKHFDYYIIVYGNASIVGGKDLWAKEAQISFNIVHATYHHCQKLTTPRHLRDLITGLFSHNKRRMTWELNNVF